jgi:hypothetical protein
MNYETTSEIEIAIARYFDTTKNIIVPNISWGMFPYELDLCILNCKSFYASEVEIKISKSDLKRDLKKHHNHDRNRNLIKYLWFAIPEKLLDCIEFVPDHAGILYVNKNGRVYLKREAVANSLARKWDVQNSYKLARLGTLRIWKLKEIILGKVKYKGRTLK